jgi:hypothetical protein
VKEQTQVIVLAPAVRAGLPINLEIAAVQSAFPLPLLHTEKPLQPVHSKKKEADSQQPDTCQALEFQGR